MALGYATRRLHDQVSELTKDLAELADTIKAHEAAHVREAEARARDRREARRYAITTALAAVATLVAIVAEFVTLYR